MINFKCPSCSKSFSVGQEACGRKTSCPKCNKKFRIPNEQEHHPENKNDFDNPAEDKLINNVNTPNANNQKLYNIKISQRLKLCGFLPLIFLGIGLSFFFKMLIIPPKEFKEKIQVDTVIKFKAGTIMAGQEVGWLGRPAAFEDYQEIAKRPNLELVPIYEEIKISDESVQFKNSIYLIFSFIFVVGILYWIHKRYRAGWIILEKQMRFDSMGWMPATKIHQEFCANEFATKDMYQSIRLKLYGKISKIESNLVVLDQVIHCKNKFPKELLISLKINDDLYASGTMKILSKTICLENCKLEKE